MARFFASLVLAALLPALAAARRADQPSPQASTQDGLLLLHKMQDALGGAKKLAAIRDYEETIRAEAWDANGDALGEVRKRTRWMRTPNVVRLDQAGPRGTYVLYFDGGSGFGWEILPDMASADLFKTTGKAVDLVGGELEFAKGYLFGFELSEWLADQIGGYVVTSPAPNVVRIERDGKATDFKLDPATSLPASSSGVSLADPSRPVPAEMRYETWKEFSGVRFPTHRVNLHSGVKRGEVFASEIRLNGGLRPADLAAKPADFAPKMKL